MTLFPPRLRRSLAAAALTLAAWPAVASLGLARLPPVAEDGPVTVFYPSASPEQVQPLGRFRLSVAEQGAPQQGNGHLVVISHGSGGMPWVHSVLARRLVEAGFVVAFPQHRRDNGQDPSDPGPDSWTIRPGEVSRAIDAVLADPRWSALDRRRMGLYGMSAGGHAALSLAGGRWSPARFKQHCDDHLDEDFAFCVGLITRLSGGPLDGFKRWAARAVIDWRFGSDDRVREDHDPRLAAIVAAVPSAADFEPASLAAPPVPLGLVNALQDRWLAPRFHGLRVLHGCAGCEDLATLPDGGHGAMLSPLPPGLDGLVGDLLNDPPGFDRASLAAVDGRIVDFFVRHLLR